MYFSQDTYKMGMHPIDCYNDEMKLAVEVNGSQHYKFNEWFQKTYMNFLKQQERDAAKREYCKQNGIFLLEIPYTVPFSDIENYIQRQLRFDNFK
jgi:very-short-patch-repair endonuclease